MRHIGAIIIPLIIIISILPGAVWGNEGRTTNSKVQSYRMDLLKKMIDSIIENNDELKSQRNLISEMESMPRPGEGFIDADEFMKTGSSDNELGSPFLTIFQIEEIRRLILERRSMLEEARQKYETLKKSLISSFLGKVTEIIGLENKAENLEEMKTFLNERLATLEMQAKTGIAEPATLYGLMERVMQAELEIENTSAALEIARLESAVNFGGDKWLELMDLLDRIE